MCGIHWSRIYVLITIVKVACCLSPLFVQAEAWKPTPADREDYLGQKHYRAGLHSQIAFADVSSEREQLTKGKQSIDAFVRTLQHNSSAANAAEGRRRGIVYPAGGTKQLVNAWVSIAIVRQRFKCQLPIELFYDGESEMPPSFRNLFQSEFAGLSLIDVSKVKLPKHHRQNISIKSYVIKAAALYATSFDEVLMLDSDNTPLVDPTTLFEEPSYLATGNAFWPDFATNTGPSIQKEAFTWLGLRVPWVSQTSYRSTESGQILLNRQRHADVLEYILFLNLHAHILYKRMHGDTGTYQIAFMLAGKGQLFNQIQWAPRMALGECRQIEQGAKEEVYPMVGAIQQNAQGEPAFLHRVTDGAKYDAHRRDFLRLAYVTTPIRADLFFTGTLAEMKPYGLVQQYANSRVDADIARRVCGQDPHLCEELTPGQGIIAQPAEWFPTMMAVLEESDGHFRAVQPRVLTLTLVG
ncbi:hypothetical protein CVIRNUC_000148 [Coccomyxa viridis]|uniref:Uncharacterized protein n=1 Tax=Coccomyxa viridis TaxID=1274662 RepID=A0AAV1HS72_9CHLO|nr:hypothetical protein CVIRNUC_000148 [Coccomyxa viridis]